VSATDFCECGCGHRTKLAPSTMPAKGWVRGEPMRFVAGHSSRVMRVTHSIPDGAVGVRGLPLGQCQCGCGATTKAAPKTNRCAGETKGWPRQFVRGHAKPRKSYTVDPATGCWNFDGTREGEYGQLHYLGRRYRAARFYYERAKGPIPAGLEVDHLCRNPRCVNPDHLEAVTPLVNKLRRKTTKLTTAEVEAIKGLPLSVRPCDAARRFGVHPTTVTNIRTGRRRRAA
jgi:hypothetical protein